MIGSVFSEKSREVLATMLELREREHKKDKKVHMYMYSGSNGLILAAD